MSVLSARHFHDEKAAFRYVESRLWPNGPVCPHCGGVERVGKLQGKSSRLGVYKCYQCRKPFTVKVGTIFESSHIPLRVWLQAIFLMAGSKKGISSNQLSRALSVTVKTAWFMSHRIREAMRGGELAPFGSTGGAVEVDETFIGRDKEQPVQGRGYSHKMKVLSLVDRESGKARSYVVDDLKVSTVAPILSENISREARLMTDEAAHYKGLGWNFAEHGVVIHSKDEYVSKADHTVHTNTIEGFFSIFKRGMRGVYQHCDKRHLHRYVAEFDFRYSNRIATGCDDKERADRILDGVTGKRLTYQTTRCAGPAFHWKEGRAW